MRGCEPVQEDKSFFFSQPHETMTGVQGVVHLEHL